MSVLLLVVIILLEVFWDYEKDITNIWVSILLLSYRVLFKENNSEV